jgi:hypothetical protein
MKRIHLLLLTLLLILLTMTATLAEDVCTVDATQVTAVTSDQGYLRVTCTLQTAGDVTLAVSDEWGGMIYQRGYGECSGAFSSEDIYLPLNGTQTMYQVTLTTPDGTYALQVQRVKPRMTDTNVTSAGLPLSDISGVSSPREAYVLNLSTMGQQPVIVPMVSGDLQLGYVTFKLSNGQLTVSAELTADGEIQHATIYIAGTAESAMSLGTSRFDGKKARLGKAADVTGMKYAVVLVQMTVSYDQSTATPLWLDQSFTQNQQSVWYTMQQETADNAVG